MTTLPVSRSLGILKGCIGITRQGEATGLCMLGTKMHVNQSRSSQLSFCMDRVEADPAIFELLCAS